MTGDAALLEVREVRSDEDIASVTALVWEFFAFLERRFPAQRADVERYLASHDVAAELADLTSHFSPPKGECLLASLDGSPVGTLMMKRIDDDLCEMNRMFVRDAARGRGVARTMIERLIGAARVMGFREMRLEALNEEIPALPLYRKLGFQTDPHPTEFALSNPRIVSLRRRL